MDKLFKKYEWLSIIVGIVMVVAAALIIILAIVDVSILNTAISYIIAVFLFMIGGILITTTLIEDRLVFFTGSLFYGAIIVAVGVVLCVLPDLIGNAIIKLVAIAAISFGVIEIIKGILLITSHYKLVAIIAAFVIAAILITLGIVGLVMNSNDILRVVYIVIGGAIAVSGIFEIVKSVNRLKNIRKHHR